MARYFVYLMLLLLAVASIWYLQPKTVPEAEIESTELPDSNTTNENNFVIGRDDLIQLSQGSVFDPETVNPAFSLVDDFTYERYEALLHEKFLDDLEDSSYIRHTIVQIETGVLRDQLDAAFRDYELGDEGSFVELPLFADAVAPVRVVGAMDGSKGMRGLFGEAILADVPFSQASFYFSDAGKFEGSISSRDNVFLVITVDDSPIYGVIQYKDITPYD